MYPLRKGGIAYVKENKNHFTLSKYQNIIDQYLSLDEFEEKAAETMRSKRVTVTAFCNYLGDQGIESINLCLQKHVVGFMENISSLSTSTKSGKNIYSPPFFNFLYAQGLILYSGRELFPVIVTNKRDRILSFYSEEEVRKLVSCIDNNTVKGKRGVVS